MANEQIGLGAAINRGDAASPEVFTEIANVTSITSPSLALETKDVTNLGTTTARTFIPGLVDSGEVTIEMNWDGSNAQITGLRTDLTSKVARNFTITFPDSPVTTAAFTAYVTSFGSPITTEDTITASVSMKVTGDVTWS